jgi:hypothetical protein
MRAKGNIGSDSGGFKYEIEHGQLADHPDVFATYAKFGERIEGSARDVLGEAEQDGDKSPSGNALEDTKQFLTELLSGGAIPQKQIEQDMPKKPDTHGQPFDALNLL